MTIEIRAATYEERPAVQHLIDLSYDAESYGPSLADPCQHVGCSHMDPDDRAENTRVLFVDGQLVSALHLHERQAHAYGERVGFGIITFVCTHPDHRLRGYMRLLMADTERHMRERGLCYGVLFGAFVRYGGSVGWRRYDEHQPPPRVLLVPAVTGTAAGDAREAGEADIPFLAAVYAARYRRRFGPVIRSPEYWRRWSLPRTWEGQYVIVHEGHVQVGYFHYGDGVDEIAWAPGAAERVVAAIASWAGAHGETAVKLWVDETDEGAQAVHRVFGEVPQPFVDPMGRVMEETDPTQARARKERVTGGLMTKWLREGPGPLAGVDSTEALTRVMGERNWAIFDGDMA